jgi:hypothetical protein
MFSDEVLRRPFGALLCCFFVWGFASYTPVNDPPSTVIVKSKQTLAMVDPRPKPKAKPAPKLATLPGGKRTLIPNFTMVALYGAPDDPALGVLGEQPVDLAIARVKQLAAEYQPHSTQKVLPTFEIISTIASAEPTENNDYSREVDYQKLETWVKASYKAGVYVLLDLQSGRSDFLSQAQPLEELLKYPNVGLALDPEWRLKPNEIPLEQIGTVDASEVNQVSAWLAELTAKNKLPQKLFLLHQFRLDMITNRASLNTTYKDLAYVIQMDGHGDQMQKQDTWNAIIAESPARMHYGWKNFHDEDLPTLSPAGTMQKVPTPPFISYQ